ncbi:MAG: sugar transporter, partial [Bacteroidia bacterium]|nr:sugar transporter [Bacteroidia bacterium]
MEEKGFDNMDNFDSGRVSFDFKGFLFKALNLWKLVLICIGFALVVAYLINVRKQNVYTMSSLISIENDQNPFFTANTSISFNWGGVSGKVGKILTTVRTRTHNEKVVDSLEFYMQYLVEGKYRKIDIYKQCPFYFEIDKSKGQLLNRPIGIRFINKTQFEIFIDFAAPRASTQIYESKKRAGANVPVGAFRQIFSIGEKIELPFLNGVIHKRNERTINPETEFFLLFQNFDSVVQRYKSSIKIAPFNKSSSSILRLVLNGTNKSKLVDFLNATAAILSKSELETKNLYATNTIRFIDSTLSTVSVNLQDVTKEMNEFRKKNSIFDVDDEISQISQQLKKFDLEHQAEESKLNYLNNLENYLRTKTDYTKIAAPTSVGIDESNILSSVAKITALSIERQNLEYTAKEGNVLFKDLDRQIDSEKNVLLETIDATKRTIGIQLGTLNRNISKLEAELSTLPEDQQEFLKIQRKLDISQEAYDIYT